MQATATSKDGFLQNVQTAVSVLLPIVDEKRPYTEKAELEWILRGSNGWISQAAVEGYHPGDFEELEEPTREVLDRGVAAFLEIARQVGPEKRATPAQVDAAIPPFLEVASIVRKIILDEWLQSARELIDQAAEWAEAENWPTKRYRWTLTERFLGTYELDRLIFGVMGSQMALIPVGRFVTSVGGAFDLAVMPAYESVMVKRGPDGRWHVEPLPGGARSRLWSRSAFVETSEKLSRMG